MATAVIVSEPPTSEPCVTIFAIGLSTMKSNGCETVIVDPVQVPSGEAASMLISASVTVTVDDTNNRVDVDMPDQVWTSATGNAVSKLLVCYDPDTGTGTDSTVLPLTYHDFVVTPDGSTITATIDPAGFGRAA